MGSWFDIRVGSVALMGVLALGATVARAADPAAARHVRAAIKAYQEGEFETAQEQYAEAELKCPECPEIAYNRGLASYRQRDFAAAREFFNSALQTRDLGLEAKTKYNLGNVAYSEALEKISNLEEAIESARTAIFHYRDALELAPEDQDARANIETAQLLIKDLLDKQKQEQEKQNQDQQQNDQNQEDQNQDDQNQDQQDQQNQDKQEQGEKNEEQDEQDQQDQQDKKDGQPGDKEKDEPSEQDKDQPNEPQPSEDQPQDQEQAQAAQEGQPRKMTEEEFAKMLQAVRDKEAQRRQDNKRRMQVRQAPVQKDW